MASSVKFAVGVHILVLLAARGETPSTSAFIASSVNTNPVVVRRLLGRLRQAGLVRITPGPLGGAILRRPASGITLRQVYDALETQPVIALHEGPNPACPVGRHIGEVLAGVTAAAEEAVHAELAALTLEEIVRRTDRKRREPRRAS